jgi:hypothetical protein
MTDTEKAIDTGALEGGGKLNPAHMPGGSELLEKPPRRKVTVITDTIKIRDVETYDPRDVSDAVLRDDFRIVLAWWAQARRGIEIPHDRQTLIRLATAIVKEAVRRGPTVIRFSPAGMTTGARELFELVAPRVGVPEPMFKALAIGPDLDPEGLATGELLDAHDRLHLLYRRAATGGAPAPGMSVEGAVNLHARIVDELEARDAKHPPPPDDGLDRASGPFEAGEFSDAHT